MSDPFSNRTVPSVPEVPAPAAHDAQSPPAVSPEQQAWAQKLLILHRQGRNGANWFYWVAALSLVNSAILLSGGGTHFVIGLGATLIVDLVAGQVAQHHPEIAMVAKGIALGFDVIAAVIVIGFGWLASKRYLAAFAIGMVLYLLDGLLFVLFQDWLSVGFHAFALVYMWKGLQSYRQLRAMEQAIMARAPLVVPETVETPAGPPAAL